MIFSAELLEETFGSETNYAISQDPLEDVAVFPDGTHWATCTNWAGYVRRILGERASIVGFFETDNPTSSIAALYGGHDLALVDERWIVDGWARSIGESTRAVFDLDDPMDEAEIRRLYGSRSTWTRMEDLERSIDDEPVIRRHAALAGTTLTLEARGLVPCS